MVKKTAQTLQSFGTELAETELPSEVQATTILLRTHTDKKDQMKVAQSRALFILHDNACGARALFVYLGVFVQEDLLVALGQGSRLLESINEPVVRDPDHNMNQDELENLATVQRLAYVAYVAYVVVCAGD